MRFYAEIRTFDKDGLDYINETIDGGTFKDALSSAILRARKLTGRVVINVFDKFYSEGTWCIWSETRRGWKDFDLDWIEE